MKLFYYVHSMIISILMLLNITCLHNTIIKQETAIYQVIFFLGILSISVLLNFVLFFKLNRLKNYLRLIEKEDNEPHNEDTIAIQLTKRLEQDKEIKRLLLRLYHLRTMQLGKFIELFLPNDHIDKIEAQNKILTMVEEMADNLINDSNYYKEIEGPLNKHADNIIKKILNDLPELKERDRKIIGLTLAGYDATMISAIMGDVSNDLIYKIKSNTKKNLLEKNNENRELYEALFQ